MKPETCKGCPLYATGAGWVPAVMPTGARLLIIGEAPGATESRTSVPFSGRSGALLDKLLRLAGIPRSGIAVHNVLSCRPPGNELRGAPFEEQAIEHCRPNLTRTLETVRPGAVLALGETAMRATCGRSGISKHRGYILIGPRGVPAIPSFHPAYLLPGRRTEEAKRDRPSRFIGLVLLDLLRAWTLSKAPFLRSPQRYILDPNPAEFAVWAARYERALEQDPTIFLTYDIETPGKTPDALPMLDQPIIRIGFAYRPSEAVTVPWSPPYLYTIRRLLGTTGMTTGWNSNGFDNLVIERRLGEPFLRGRHYDMMRGWHVFQSDVPKTLESVAGTLTDLFPWKDLSASNPPLYNATDCDAQIRVSYAVRENLQPRGQWDVFERLITDLYPILREAGERGLPIDVQMHGMLRERYQRELLYVMGEVQALDNVQEFAPVKLYVRQPEAPAVPVTRVENVKVCTCGALAPTVVHYRDTKKRGACAGRPTTREQEVVRWQRVLPEELLSLPFEEAMDEIRTCGFNPLSLPQVGAYANQYRHLELIDVKDDKLDDTVIQALIKRFGTTHPLYRLVGFAREKNKLLGTYVEGYQPDARGNIYTRYNDNPSTLRLGSANVNTQNVHDDIKRMIVAPPGWTIVEGDSSAIEAVLVGYSARSPQYVRLAAKGVHDFLNCKAAGIEFDEEGIQRSKTEFREIRKRKKMTVHLSNYGGTPRMMCQQAPEVYPAEFIAKNEQAFYFEVCPDIRPWQRRVRAETARTHVLVNEWNFHQYFHEVFNGADPGADFNRCVGAGPQSLAAFIMRENLLLVGGSEWRSYMYANCNTHDSLALLVPLELEERAIEYLAGVLSRPIPQLDNLLVGCEVKRARRDTRSWKDMEVVHAVKHPDPLALSSWHRSLVEVSA